MDEEFKVGDFVVWLNSGLTGVILRPCVEFSDSWQILNRESVSYYKTWKNNDNPSGDYSSCGNHGLRLATIDEFLEFKEYMWETHNINVTTMKSDFTLNFNLKMKL